MRDDMSQSDILEYFSKRSIRDDSHRAAFFHIMSFMTFPEPERQERIALNARLITLYGVLEKYMQQRVKNPSLGIDEPPFHEVEHTREDFLLFLEILRRVERVAVEAEAYHSRPSCTIV